MGNIIVNADDLGMTPGTNKAIFKGYDHGIITHSSIMSNGDYFTEAVEGLKNRKDLNIGIHLNLTYGKALNYNQIYNDKRGLFNLGFMEILIKSLFDKNFIKEVKKEFELQIRRAMDSKIAISHIDSHRHIHMIPKIYDIVVDLSVKYDIKKVRLINESLIDSVSTAKSFDFILNGGLIKFILLKTFNEINTRKTKLHNLRFFSILYTGTVRKDILAKLRASKYDYEVMVHPGITDADLETTFYDEGEKAYRLSKNREIELDAVLDENVR
ncbi:MAG: hypothetical protein B5M52_05640 [Helicobacteraceae bacterium 4484_230]|nr:MAG: hypothetical protein B5M52_05640 [Helicobacteraceae bacterium 4484_230]